MKTMTKTLSLPTLSGFETLARRLLFGALENIRHGHLIVHDPDGSVYEFRGAEDGDLQATVHVESAKCYGRILAGGSRGTGEAYFNGEFEVDDLTALFRIFLVNKSILQGLESGWAKLTLPASKAYHWFNRNSRSQSRRNIATHYDLGNDLFELFLDSTMMYSCGVFDSPADTMEEASNRKNDLICQKLELTPDDHLVEIGTGWGGFALHAAKHYGCRITTTTISNEQYELATRRIKEAGLDDLVTVILEDYRDIDGTYDKLVSIEMIEAVGWENYETYFGQCASLLKPDGLMLVQAITVPDNEFENAKRTVDFIKRYIFPGGCLPSVEAMVTATRKVTDLQLVDLQDIGQHYVHTLRAWLANFEAKKGQVATLGYDDRFIRLWRFYLCYCEAGFAERATSNVHAVFAKPAYRNSEIQ